MAPFGSGLLSSNTVRSPATIAYGRGAVSTLGEFVREQSVESSLVVTDQTLADADVIAPVVESLRNGDVSVDVFDGVHGEPKLSTPGRAATILRDGGHDLVVGVGGGSCMDTAKLASVLCEYDVPIREMVGMGNVPGRGRPVALVSTTAGSGSEVTHIGVFTDDRNEGVKQVIYDETLFASLSIVDPTMTETLPSRVAAATGLDALTHAVEAYTTRRRTPYTDMLAREAIERIGRSLRPAVETGATNVEARAEMHYAAMLAGQAFVNSGLGAVHALTYPLGIEYDLGHGEANARLLPHVMAFNRPADPDRFANMANWLGVEADGSVEDRSRAAVDAVFSLAETVGITPSIGGLGEFDRDDFSRFADIAFEYSEHNVRRNPREMDRDDAIEIYGRAQ